MTESIHHDFSIEPADGERLANLAGPFDEHLRQIDVSFVVKGFGPGEILDSITFDGVSVTPQAI